MIAIRVSQRCKEQPLKDKLPVVSSTTVTYSC